MARKNDPYYDLIWQWRLIFLLLTVFWLVLAAVLSRGSLVAILVTAAVLRFGALYGRWLATREF